MFLLWPVFDTDFWFELWIAYPALLGALALSCFVLLRSRRWLNKAAGALIGIVGVCLAGLMIFLFYQLSSAGASIGLLETAESSSDPGSSMIHEVYIQLRSTTAEAAPPIVYLAGGPGGPATLTLFLTQRYPLFMAMREFGDVIAWDQRGTMPWNDAWLMCPSTWDYPLDEPLRIGRYLDLKRQAIRQCQQHFSAKDIDLATYNTQESVEDLDDLRKHLASEQLTLWATSYGTHLALAYIKKYPDRVDRAILHGVEGLDHTLKLPSQVQAALEVTADLARDDATLRGRVPDLLADIEAVLEQLEANPVSVTLGDGEDAQEVTIGAYDIQLMTADHLRNAQSRASLPLAFAEMKRGDFSRWGQLAASRRQGNWLSMMSFNMDCASGASDARRHRIQTEAPETLLGNVINEGYPEICDVSDSRDLGQHFREPVETDIPTLFISGTLDGRTPVANAEQTMAGFARGEHLIIEGAGHSDELFVSSPEILKVMQEFMRGEAISTHRIEVPFQFSPIDSG